MNKFTALLVVVLALSSCGPQENYSGAIAAAVPASKSIKSQIVQDARNLLLDPYSVRDAEISYVATFSDGTQGVCVRANTKNALGGYVGRRSMAITIRNGRLASSVVNHPLCSRPDIRWQPFKQLEALKNL